MNSNHVLEVDDYEAANLLAGLVFLRDVGGDTGDWHAQLVHKLLDLNIQTKPNKDHVEQKRELARKIGWKVLFPS